MNKEETIIKYFSGNYAYDLFLMGMIFGNPIYSEYISNKEMSDTHKVDIIDALANNNLVFRKHIKT